MIKKALFMSALAFAGACSDDQADESSTEQGVITVQHMSDATTGGTADFYFLTPTAPSDPTSFSGPFNKNFTARLKVEIRTADCNTWVAGSSAYTFNTVSMLQTISAYRVSATLATMGLVNGCYAITPTLDGASLGYRHVVVDSSTAAPPAGVIKWKGTGNQIVSFTLRNQVDTDSDGVLNHVDACPTVNGNGAPDGCPITDNCPSDPNKTEPGHCGCGFTDTDLDGDSHFAGPGGPDGDGTCDDLCDNDGNKQTPGACGCGYLDIDNDGDHHYYNGSGGSGSACDDECDGNSLKVGSGACGCNAYLVDWNEDGTADGCSDQNSCTFTF